jgi:hypothetical protein
MRLMPSQQRLGSSHRSKRSYAEDCDLVCRRFRHFVGLGKDGAAARDSPEHVIASDEAQ